MVFNPLPILYYIYALAIHSIWIRKHSGASEQLVEDVRQAVLGVRHKAWLAALSSTNLDITTSFI